MERYIYSDRLKYEISKDNIVDLEKGIFKEKF
jgi:hypothetical protein